MIAIVIPTRDRPDMLAPLVRNIEEATEGPHRTYLVMERDDRASIDAVAELNRVAGLRTIDVLGEFGSCSVAINAGYRASTEPFVAIANDDVVFHPGWDAAALAQFSETVHVVGMNDGSGDCLCFPMVRRSFIEEHSGVYDRPNTIFHTYKSQGPDTEFSFYAILRGVWAPAGNAIVEHRRIDPELHLKARDAIADDLAEYHRRWPEWDPERRMPPPVPTVRSR